VIIDSSALVAIMFQEPRYDELVDRIAMAGSVGIGAPTLVETTLVASSRLHRDMRGTVARILQELGIEILPFTTSHFGIAVDAWLRFGKGRHAANLNYGDCLAYAVARLADRPLLCVGNDFRRTDLELA
jgi:ribonuclease VapC